MKKTASSLMCGLFFFGTLASSALGSSCGDEAICAVGSPWFEANIVKFKISPQNPTDYKSIELEVADNKDMALSTAVSQNGKTNSGKLMLISGRVMLAKGMDLPKGYEIDALDGPALMYQLVVSLLTQALPHGPAQTEIKKDIAIHEKQKGIKVATASAGGLFGPPWQIKGSIDKHNNNHYSYNLAFYFSSPQANANETILHIVGTWEKVKPSPQFADEMKLDGWQLYNLGPLTRTDEGSTILDYGARLREGSITTLGSLRRAIAEEEKRE